MSKWCAIIIILKPTQPSCIHRSSLIAFCHYFHILDIMVIISSKIIICHMCYKNSVLWCPCHLFLLDTHCIQWKLVTLPNPVGTRLIMSLPVWGETAGDGIMFSGCLSVHPCVHSSVSILVNAVFWIRINQFWCQLAQVMLGTRAWNDQSLGSGGRNSRSHEVEDWFGGVAEALFLIPSGQVAFLVIYSLHLFKASDVPFIKFYALYISKCTNTVYWRWE